MGGEAIWRYRANGLIPPLWALNLLLVGLFAVVLTALVIKVRQLHGNVRVQEMKTYRRTN
jgi:hypothetical protein